MNRCFLFAAAIILGCGLSADAQTLKSARPMQQTDTPSVVILPESQRPKIDSAALRPEKQKKHRRFEVKIVPAPPPGRSRQEILYSDSLGRR